MLELRLTTLIYSYGKYTYFSTQTIYLDCRTRGSIVYNAYVQYEFIVFVLYEVKCAVTSSDYFLSRRCICVKRRKPGWKLNTFKSCRISLWASYTLCMCMCEGVGSRVSD